MTAPIPIGRPGALGRSRFRPGPRPATPVAPRIRPVANGRAAFFPTSGHPLAEPAISAALARRAEEIDRAFAAIEPVLVTLAPRQFEPGFAERAAAEIASVLGVGVEPARLEATWNRPLDMVALQASLVLRTFARLVERTAARPPAVEEGEPVAEIVRHFGFHGVDVSTCADGRLGGLLDHVLRVPPAIVVARKSFAGAMFDVEEAIARFERVELGRWREGRPNPASEPTRYLKLGVYHFSSLDPQHEGCAAHGSDERRAAAALLARLRDFAEAVARRHGEAARPAILLVGVDTDTDSIRVHVPDPAGEIDLDRYLSSAELHAATRDLPRAEAKEEIRRRVAASIGVAPDDPATEGMRWFCGYLLKNNVAQVDAVLTRFAGPYPDRGHEERLIVVGDPIDDVQLRNLAFQAQMRSIEEGEGDVEVGIRILGGRLGPAGLAVPVLVLQTFDDALPGAAERAADRAALMLRALERRFPAAAGAPRVVAEAAIRANTGGPLRFLSREACRAAGRRCAQRERIG
ncbi:MAG: carboxysome shell carbonic anhydrase [Geminicoccaceae bacterium]